MTPGISFQPGASDGQPQMQGRSAQPSNSVQEAIKVLSLRLPKVVGARSIAPAPLLTSAGSNGNPRIDSVVNQVMARMFPTQGGGMSAPAPMIPPPSQESAPEAASPMPQFEGAAMRAGARREAPSIDRLGTLSRDPRIIYGNPESPMDASRTPQMPQLDASGMPPAMIAPDPSAELWRRLQQAFSQPPPEPEPPFAI